VGDISPTVTFLKDRDYHVAEMEHIMAKSTLGERKIAEAKAHLAAQQIADRAAEKKAQQSAHKNQTTKRPIVGNLRSPLQHKTALQHDLTSHASYFPVPAKMTKVQPAVASTTDSQGYDA
jgi:hypothetical protein